MNAYKQWKHRLSAIQAIDFHLAVKVCEWLHPENELLFHSVIATSEALHDGHTCLSLESLAGTVCWSQKYPELPGYQFPGIDQWRTELEAFALLPENQAPIVFDNGRLYLRRYWNFEGELATELASFIRRSVVPDKKQLKSSLEKLFPGADDEPDWQKVACGNALLSGFQIISGGPGTGKTYTVTRLLAALISTSNTSLKLCLTAPTGKAAQRLGESIKKGKSELGNEVDFATKDQIPDDAITLHRLLGVIPGKPGFRHSVDNKLNLDVIVVDEVSMVDLPLMTRLFRALPEYTRVILLGDADQLPSVAAGSVLGDLAVRPHTGYSSGRLSQLKKLGITTGRKPVKRAVDHVSFLKKSRRFSGESGIGQLALQVMSGLAEESWESLQGDWTDLSQLEEEDFPTRLSQWIRDFYSPVTTAASVDEAFSILNAFRILCPTRVGEFGTLALNEQIERQLNPRKLAQYQGRAIMITENNYEVGLFNGDIGIIWPDSKNRFMAWFETAEGCRPVVPGRLPAFEPVFAMTIHKTQGSEFNHVAMVLPEGINRLTSRELIFTGLTRARSRFEVVGSEAAWKEGVSRQVQRSSGLNERLELALSTST